MRVSEAIDSRISCREFLDTPLPKHVVIEILETAKRAPSGGNLQPWRVDVLTGAR
jgi:nitroreductase